MQQFRTQFGSSGWLVVPLLAVLLLAGPSPAHAQDSSPVDVADAATPPRYPTDVVVTLSVEEVTTVNERDGFVEISGTLYSEWEYDLVNCDPEGSEVYQGEGAVERLKTMWWPALVLRDGIGPREVTSISLRRHCGFGLIEERFLATVAQDFASLNDFPFDSHDLAFTVMSAAWVNDEVQFVDELSAGPETRRPADPDSKKQAEPDPDSSFDWKSPEWEISEFETSLLINPYDELDAFSQQFSDDEFDEAFVDDDGEFDLDEFAAQSLEYLFETKPHYFADPDDDSTIYADFDKPTATFALSIERRSMFYVWNIILPLFLIVSISWVVFWGNRGMSLAERVAISITCLLTVVAFDFLTGDSLPKLAFTTRLDAFYNWSYLFVAFTVVESVISAKRPTPTTVAAGRDDEHDADRGEAMPVAMSVPPPTRIDQVSRWLIPLAYVVAVSLSLFGVFSPGLPGG